MGERCVSLIPLDKVTAFSKNVRVFVLCFVLFECVSFLSTSVTSETFFKQDGWHVLGTEQRHRTETKPL